MNAVLTRAITLCLILAATTAFLANARRVEVTVAREDFDSFPTTVGSWQSIASTPLEQSILNVLGVDDYLSRVYRADDALVGLYMGYYASQRQGDTIHSPLNCLPGAGWEPVSQARLLITNVDGRGRDIAVNRYIVQKGLDRQLVLYWYQSHGRVVASEYTSKLYLIHDAVRLNRTDGAMVRVIAPVLTSDGDAAPAERLAENFVRTIFPHLDPYLGH
jgi:EpsI family protein